jgi:hypothetical protein
MVIASAADALSDALELAARRAAGQLNYPVGRIEPVDMAWVGAGFDGAFAAAVLVIVTLAILARRRRMPARPPTGRYT